MFENDAGYRERLVLGGGKFMGKSREECVIRLREFLNKGMGLGEFGGL